MQPFHWLLFSKKSSVHPAAFSFVNYWHPNTFTNLETGLKWDFVNGLSFTAAVFEIEQSSPQVADDDPSTLEVIDSEITGFEAQLKGQVSDDWYWTNRTDSRGSLRRST